MVCSFLVTVMIFCSCTNSGNLKSDYAYYFGFDRGRQDDVVMYVLMKKDVNDKSGDNTYIEQYEGKNVKDTFESFFENHKDAYTGTVKEYVVGESMGEGGLEELRAYIANSPRLPAKRKTNIYDSGAGFIYEKMEEKQ